MIWFQFQSIFCFTIQDISVMYIAKWIVGNNSHGIPKTELCLMSISVVYVTIIGFRTANKKKHQSGQLLKEGGCKRPWEQCGKTNKIINVIFVICSVHLCDFL